MAQGLGDKDDLTAEILEKLAAEFPGVEFNFSQYLQDNVAEAVSGVKGENSIKLFGNDLQALTDTANKIKAVLATVPGITDLAVFTSLGQPTVQIDVDRARAARYGLAPGDINATIRVAIGGESAGDLYEPGSDRHFPIVVRLAPQFRQDPAAIQNLRIGVQGPNGITQIPLSDVANVKLVSGASYIYREGQERYLPIKFSVRDRDLGSAIQEAQRKVAEQVTLPAGSRHRMGRRVRQPAGRDRAAQDRGPAQPRPDRAAALGQFRLRTRHAPGHERHPDGGGRRHLRAGPAGNSVQRLGRDRVHRAVRHFGDGRHHHPLAVQCVDRCRASIAPRRSCAPASFRCARC